MEIGTNNISSCWLLIIEFLMASKWMSEWNNYVKMRLKKQIIRKTNIPEFSLSMNNTLQAAPIGSWWGAVISAIKLFGSYCSKNCMGSWSPTARVYPKICASHLPWQIPTYSLGTFIWSNRSSWPQWTWRVLKFCSKIRWSETKHFLDGWTAVS